ncbi:ribonucleotide-diphosphate reductase subunit alpha, partial [Patescibacteria group bacterium]|nr:ribonucleotide-diphosphate reductase subunit alpha [Patescibacteria group bacterium]
LNLKFLPNTPTLMNAGEGLNGMLSACFVIPVYDSLESIVHEAGWQQAAIHKMGGGIGLNLSNLRPKGDLINSTGGMTGGVLSFLRLFDRLSDVIHQGGKRNGANMGILNIDHPEIENFINCKITNKLDYNNFNLSVMITDKFMNAVKNNLEWELKFKDKVYKTVNANYLFNLICNGAWNCGCPGMIFEDIINKNNLFDKLPGKNRMQMNTTNPCGEQPLFCGEYKDEIIAESCNLGSINLSKYVDEKGSILWDELKNTVNITTMFLDKVIDVNNYPFDYIDKGTKLTRKIGLGVTGFSDMLIKMNISYDSDEAIKLAKRVMKFIQRHSHITSENMGKTYDTYPLAKLVGDNKRNAAITTIAPTGTIGRLMIGHGYALGIEPPFALNMKSNIIETSIEEGVHPLLIEKLNALGIDLDFIMNELNKDGSSIQHIKEIPEDVRKLFLTAHEISIEQHLKIQEAFQLYTDSAVSKTINLKNEATVDDVRKAFIMAYDLKCKGVTIFRNMSKDGVQVMVSSSKDAINGYDEDIIDDVNKVQDLVPRPEILPATTFAKKSGCNTMFITLTHLQNKDGILECFINTSGKGGCRSMQDGLAIAISVYQRYIEGVIGHEHATNALKIVSNHLMNVTCQSSMIAFNKQKYDKKIGNEIEHEINSRSCPNAVAQVIKYMIDNPSNELISDKVIDNYKIDNKVCSECGVELVRQEGCSSMSCPNCGIGGCN